MSLKASMRSSFLAKARAWSNFLLIMLQGSLLSPINPPSGCVFRTRCPEVQAQCAKRRPALRPINGTHQVSCILV